MILCTHEVQCMRFCIFVTRFNTVGQTVYQLSIWLVCS